MLSAYFIAAHKSEEVLKKSSSGGMFTILAEYVFSKNGVVFGAVFDSSTKSIHHDIANKLEEIEKMRKSKYVWSDFSGCFALTEKAIEENKYILFTGTPCQCAAIKRRYCDYEHLIVVSLFCHGTGESKYFKEYLDDFLPEVSHVDFRYENENNNSNFTVYMERGGCKERLEDFNENIFTQLFVNSAVIRKECFHCSFATKQHVSDFSIGDFEFKELARTKYGIDVKHPSIVAVNTQKAIRIWDDIQKNDIVSAEVDEQDRPKLQYYYRNHEDLTGSWGYNKDIKDKFERDYNRYGFKKAALMNLYPNIIKQVEKALENAWDNLYLYGYGKIGKTTKLIIEEIYPELVINGFIVTKLDLSETDSLGIYDIETLVSQNEDINILVSVSDKFKLEILNTLKCYGCKNVI